MFNYIRNDVPINMSLCLSVFRVPVVLYKYAITSMHVCKEAFD